MLGRSCHLPGQSRTWSRQAARSSGGKAKAAAKMVASPFGVFMTWDGAYLTKRDSGRKRIRELLMGERRVDSKMGRGRPRPRVLSQARSFTGKSRPRPVSARFLEFTLGCAKLVASKISPPGDSPA